MLQAGDKVEVNCGLYKHVAIYRGHQWDGRDFIHNAKNGCVSLATVDEFAAGKQIFLCEAAPDDYFQRQAIIERAMSLLGTKYDLINFNCEHFANYAQKGRSESPQLAAGAAVLALLGIFAAVLAFGRRA